MNPKYQSHSLSQFIKPIFSNTLIVNNPAPTSKANNNTFIAIIIKVSIIFRPFVLVSRQGCCLSLAFDIPILTYNQALVNKKMIRFITFFIFPRFPPVFMCLVKRKGVERGFPFDSFLCCFFTFSDSVLLFFLLNFLFEYFLLFDTKVYI